MSSTVEAKNLNAAVEKPVKEKKAKVPKEKKAKTAKTASHPPYFQMIKEALLALNEKGGSSPHAIGKYLEDKHKAVLPANFRKTLALQLKNSASKGKLIKVKASYKLSDATKKSKSPAAGKKSTKAARATATTTGGRKKATKATPAKKAVKAVKTTPMKKTKKMTPAKAKQPKSIRSPAAKRAKKASV
ncbi:putative histone H5, winged helix-like DNA-binding domain superfamily [Helianthus annuus]|uniref:Histone H5, winged helix-like DNA-binding domain superfamily n=1 Tax=Helianthus annuus TaxID=4232 RepID=A0A251S3L8_HELAN|nr:histone H1 [Helianthus annuus]KAF5762408.1 putative histone H5, winged helix-like DNA-binding domain superfamily [Helianthus annuus]KAJ0440140.1 putative linker histone H1/H5, domain H15, winged helix-like DNA-binding domain superfamily [Helianthus annuus]KAJ0642922.1 putative linker histone H1/H5, domain H15, winged helix-like DNA-binding domain superfamily [Helianthus annuus]KAJ0646786.1 putative linker histone H1/H5, domain H15, winged helix-like DNA-binding domain superfamily [Helianthus